MEGSTPMEVTEEEGLRIITTRKPRGLFYTKEGDLFVGIDNSTGDAWVEEFHSKNLCIRWLLQKGGGGDTKFQELTEKIDQADRHRCGAWEAWDLINGLVNQVYGIDIGDALAAYERRKK